VPDADEAQGVVVETPLTRRELEDPARRALFLEVIPMERPVQAQEVANAAAFLASDLARSITGHTIVIDGVSLTRGYPALLSGLQTHHASRINQHFDAASEARLASDQARVFQGVRIIW
jgi:hypothetical protein